MQDNIYLSSNNNFISVNYGVEPIIPPGVTRYSGYTIPASCNGDYNCLDLSLTYSNLLPSQRPQTPPPPPPPIATSGDPQTPVFSATAGTPVRFRMLHGEGLGGFPDNSFTLHGHVWQEEPYIADSSGNPSTVLGNNILSQWMGARDGFGSGNHFDILLPSAGGVNGVTGDYLYQNFPAQEGGYGSWGVFRVTKKGTTTTTMAATEMAAKAPLPPPKVTPRQAPPKDPGERFLRPRDKKKK
jgi:hypothetical protein